MPENDEFKEGLNEASESEKTSDITQNAEEEIKTRPFEPEKANTHTAPGEESAISLVFLKLIPR